MKPFRVFSVLALALTLAPAVLAADFGVRAGRYDDRGEEFVGAEMVFDIGSLNVNPNLEYSLEDDVTAGSANLDVTFDLGNFGRATPYVGAGVGVLYLDDDAGNDTTELVGNVIGGVQFDLEFLRPYAQVKYFRLVDDNGGSNQDDLAFTIGLRF